MILLDYLVYIVYSFSLKKLRRTNDEALFSAICILSVYSTFFILGFVSFIGFIADNSITKAYIASGELVTIIIGIITLKVWSIRYYKIIDLNQRINSIKKETRKYLHLLVYFMLFAIPIFSFLFFRLYNNVLHY